MMKEEKLSQQSKRELVEAVRDRYLRAGRQEKSKILDEFVAITGFHRKHAIRVLRQGYHRERERRGRGRMYSGTVVSTLAEIWRICGCICGKRLQPFLPQLVQSLERHGELSLDEETKDKVTITESDIEADEQKTAISLLLNKLTLEERNLLVLRHFEDHTFGEIAEIMSDDEMDQTEINQFAATLRKRITRLYDKLKKMINSEPLLKELFEV